MANISLHFKPINIFTTKLFALVIIAYVLTEPSYAFTTSDIKNIEDTCKDTVYKLRSEKNSQNYYAAASCIWIWRTSYSLFLSGEIKHKIGYPIYSESKMIEFAEKSINLGGFDAANFLVSFYAEYPKKRKLSLSISNCWQMVAIDIRQGRIYRNRINKCSMMAKLLKPV